MQNLHHPVHNDSVLDLANCPDPPKGTVPYNCTMCTITMQKLTMLRAAFYIHVTSYNIVSSECNPSNQTKQIISQAQ
jgi:hypothetical protein